jgi:hypothetical protein
VRRILRYRNTGTNNDKKWQESQAEVSSHWLTPQFIVKFVLATPVLNATESKVNSCPSFPSTYVA